MSVTERAASSGGRRRRVTVTGGDPLCAICLETRHHAVETSCGHLFCAKCLFTHQQQGDPLQGMLCPLCRQQVRPEAETRARLGEARDVRTRKVELIELN